METDTILKIKLGIKKNCMSADFWFIALLLVFTKIFMYFMLYSFYAWFSIFYHFVIHTKFFGAPAYFLFFSKKLLILLLYTIKYSKIPISEP